MRTVAVRPHVRLSLVLSASVGVAAAATPSASLPATAPASPTIPFTKYKLENGLEVILAPDKRLPVVAVNLWYHVGAANETPDRTGFAHLFEHMMFTGTKHSARGESERLLEAAGGADSNASTGLDRTNYFDTVPANQLALALWTHADRMGYLLDALDQKALSNQQDVVRNERRETTENRPYGIVDEALYHELFPPGHPYRPAVIGSHADIQAAKLADVRDFFKRYYRPNNATLVIAGDFDPANARRLVQRYFGSFTRGADVPKPAVVTPPIDGERRLEVTDRIELPRVDLAWLTPPAFSARRRRARRRRRDPRRRQVEPAVQEARVREGARAERRRLAGFERADVDLRHPGGRASRATRRRSWRRRSTRSSQSSRPTGPTQAEVDRAGARTSIGLFGTPAAGQHPREPAQSLQPVHRRPRLPRAGSGALSPHHARRRAARDRRRAAPRTGASSSTRRAATRCWRRTCPSPPSRRPDRRPRRSTATSRGGTRRRRAARGSCRICRCPRCSSLRTGSPSITCSATTCRSSTRVLSSAPDSPPTRRQRRAWRTSPWRRSRTARRRATRSRSPTSSRSSAPISRRARRATRRCCTSTRCRRSFPRRSRCWRTSRCGRRSRKPRSSARGGRDSPASSRRARIRSRSPTPRSAARCTGPTSPTARRRSAPRHRSSASTRRC